MKTFDEWMNEYGESHQNPTNQMIHKICVPLIMLTVVGFLWSIPRPLIFGLIPCLNWATLFLTGCLVFYFTLNVTMFMGMIVQTVIMCFICQKLYERDFLLLFSVVVFILAWVGQFWGHKIEGKKPSFFQDVVFLLIGPLWVTRFFYKKIGIRI
jgi:uncharacterized membrane protein YGL010W